MELLGRGLYAILDLDRLAGRDVEPLASALLLGGAVAVQVRAKRAGARALLDAATLLAPLCASAGAPLVVNDRPDVARLAGAWGVHVGQEDISVSDARLVAPGLAVGVSTHTVDEVEAALGAGADYVGFGPVFATGSKADARDVVGTALLSRAVERARIPVVAIGGIDATRAREVARAGAWAAAAISAVDTAADPEDVARSFRRAFGGDP